MSFELISSSMPRGKVAHLEKSVGSSLVIQLRIRLPYNAEDMGHLEDSNAIRQLSLCATTTEPMLHNKRSHCNEKPAHGNEE